MGAVRTSREPLTISAQGALFQEKPFGSGETVPKIQISESPFLMCQKAGPGCCAVTTTTSFEAQPVAGCAAAA